MMKITIVVLLFLAAHAQPIQDEVTGAIVNYTDHKWYSGTSPLLQAISPSTPPTTPPTTTSSSTPRKAQSTIPSSSGSTAVPAAPPSSAWSTKMVPSSSSLAPSTSKPINTLGTRKPTSSTSHRLKE